MLIFSRKLLLLTVITSLLIISLPVSLFAKSPESSVSSTPLPVVSPSPSPDLTVIYQSSAPKSFVAGDINKDGIVNIQDYSLLSTAITSKDLVCDLNSDGTVNIQDFVIISNNFGKSS